jgi:DMSO/TMAO reductase YedYZ molybdopterin-dependent catalytic subunit
VLHAYDSGWTANLPIEFFLSDNSLLADMHDGKAVSTAHGGPVRALVPQKIAKRIRGIEFVSENRAGYWEDGGYRSALRGANSDFGGIEAAILSTVCPAICDGTF